MKSVESHGMLREEEMMSLEEGGVLQRNPVSRNRNWGWQSNSPEVRGVHWHGFKRSISLASCRRSGESRKDVESLESQ